MSDFLFPIIEIVLGVVLLFAGGEIFIQGKAIHEETGQPAMGL